MTAKQVAAVLGVTELAARGLLTFMSQAGLIEVKIPEKQPGQKGKASALWQLDQEAIAKLAVYLNSKIHT